MKRRPTGSVVNVRFLRLLLVVPSLHLFVHCQHFEINRQNAPPFRIQDMLKVVEGNSSTLFCSFAVSPVDPCDTELFLLLFLLLCVTIDN